MRVSGVLLFADLGCRVTSKYPYTPLFLGLFFKIET